MGDCIFPRQRERSQDRRVRRQHRPRHQRVERLPTDVLALAWLRLVLPVEYPVKAQMHDAVRVGEDARDPGTREADLDAELLVELARDGMRRRLTFFDLAARKFPIA